MNFPYTGNIPDPPHTPATDVPNMQTNTNSIQSWADIDHYGFNTSGPTNNFGGLHSQVRMPTLGNFNTKPTQINNGGNVYVNTTSGVSELYYIPDTSGKAYQLTNTSTANYSTFATNPGWSFLPGGLIIQWGVVSVPSGLGGPFNFPRTFNTFYTISLTMDRSSTASTSYDIFLNGTPTNSSFRTNSGTSGAHNVYFIAIGF